MVGSHHESVKISGIYVGHARITNDGTILSIWIKHGKQQMLFIPEHPELVEKLLEEEE